MGLRVVQLADAKLMPWANGKGVTRELLRRERGGKLELRLSVADVVEDGAFSPLPGIDRHLLLLDGTGFDLEINGFRQSVAPLSPIAFSGDDAVAAVNVAGRSRDFNVMCGRGLCRADVLVQRHRFDVVLADISYFFVVDGTFSFEGLGLATQTAGALIEIADQPGMRLDVRGQGALIVVQVFRPR